MTITVTVSGPAEVDPDILAPTISITGGIVGGPFVLSGSGEITMSGGKSASAEVSFIIGGRGRILMVGPSPMPDSLWTVTTENEDGGGVVEVPWFNLQYSEVLNDSGTCVFSVPFHHPLANRDTLDPRTRIIRVYRDGTQRWSGRIWSVTAGTDNTLQISGNGWFEDLKHRIILPQETLSYEGVDVWVISWDAIEYTQGRRDLGITRGVLGEKGRPLTRDYHWYDPWDIAGILTDVQGTVDRNYDFLITHDKVWMTYRRGVIGGSSPEPNPDLVLEQNVNIMGMNYSDSANELSNKIVVFGRGEGKHMKYAEASDDSLYDSQGLRQGIWQRNFNPPPPWDDLEKPADRYLEQTLERLIQPQVRVKHDDMDYDAYGVADIGKITYSDGYIDLDGFWRLVTRTVQIANSGREEVELFFDAQNTGARG